MLALIVIMLCCAVLCLQAELEASAESGATVTITLPDTGKQVKVAVGQDWVDVQEPQGVTATATAGGFSVPGGGVVRRYAVKWVQDEFGALAVLEVVPAANQQQEQRQQRLSVSGGSLAVGTAVAPVAC